MTSRRWTGSWRRWRQRSPTPAPARDSTSRHLGSRHSTRACMTG
jgi:hypothetical protein